MIKIINTVLKKRNRISVISSDNNLPDEYKCKICLECGPGLISPCSCNGSLKFVHYNCIQTWISYRNEERTHCEICKQKYDLTKFKRRKKNFCKLLCYSTKKPHIV